MKKTVPTIIIINNATIELDKDTVETLREALDDYDSSMGPKAYFNYAGNIIEEIDDSYENDTWFSLELLQNGKVRFGVYDQSTQTQSYYIHGWGPNVTLHPFRNMVKWLEEHKF